MRRRVEQLMFNGSFSHRLLASSFRFSRAFSREERCWWQRRWREMVVVVAVDTSFIFHPTTHHARVSMVLFTSLTSYSLLRRVAPSWALPLSHPLRPSSPFFPSSRSQEETRVRPPLHAVVSLCFSYFSSPFSVPPFCSPALYPPTSLSLLIFFPFSFLLFRLFVRVLRIFWQLFRRTSCLRVFFVPKCNVPFLFYLLIFFRLRSSRPAVNRCEFNCEKSPDEYLLATLIFLFCLIIFNWSISYLKISVQKYR